MLDQNISNDNGHSIGPLPTVTSRNLPRKPTDGVSSTWYLGGNHATKLLLSVDGDLDPKALCKLTAVPTNVGELALSVESLVTDDDAVGGFENDLLAKITSNTLAAKQASKLEASQANEAENTSAELSNTSAELSPRLTLNVPTPLVGSSSYKPVPNPLAASITPPDSPVSSARSKKRKNTPTTSTLLPKAKKIARCKVPATIKAIT